ncbi:MAG TPA: DUF1501 domain-containing protein [Verrucomicrobiae bacterium]|nr:DUF1501 domain-containing protein [Verrucomicrobiae bacterium]
MANLNILTRRSFLSQSFKTSMLIALSTLADIPFVMKRALAEGNIGLNGKKVLFIWLRGANDSLNSVIPVGDPQYYVNRPSIGIPADAGIDYGGTGPAFDATQYTDATFALRGATDATYSYGKAITLGNGFAALHPALKFLAPVYNAGDLALIHRVAYPKQSRSHFDSQNYWENGNPNNNLSKDGIFYRTIIESGLANTSPLTGVSIQSALPLILRGSAAAMTNLTDPTRYDLLGVPTPAGDNKALNAIKAANNFPFPDKRNRELLELQYANMANTLSIFGNLNFGDSGNIFQDDLKTDGDTAWAPINSSGASIGDPAKGYFLFPNTDDKNGGYRRTAGTTAAAFDANKQVIASGHKSFFTNLKAAAMILNNTDAIIAGTELGGFDTHQSEGAATGTHANLQRAIGWSMYALRKYFTLYANKVNWNDVVVVTLSEFGRTAVENSDYGTDHAEAGVMFVAGGSVHGHAKTAPDAPGVFGCSPGEAIPWITGPRTSNLATCGTMFAANTGITAGYLRRSCDYRSVLGEIIRKHLGATQNQLNRIIPGYANANENLLAGGTSGVDGVQIRGEVGIL